MRNFILLFVNGQLHRLTGSDAFLTLSDYLRNSLKLCGTKIVCSEGDCGSCSVLCGKIEHDKIEYRPIDSCIRFMYQLDGQHVVTVEGLGSEQEVSPIQQAMIDCHGSQCGFCTPGFVVAMTGLVEQFGHLDEQQWRTGLSGNLCRCTGYSPIIEAAMKSNVVEETIADGHMNLQRRFPVATMYLEINESHGQSVLIETQTEPVAARVFCPTNVAEALEYLDQNENVKVVAGATDVGVQFNKRRLDATNWLDLNRVEELVGVRLENKTFEIGARTSWTEFAEQIRDTIPQLFDVISIFGSPQIRHVGTIGGNLINASPISDSIPFLLICDAELELASCHGTRSVNINDFYHGYKQYDLKPNELLTRIRFQLPADSAQLRLYKVSRRRDMDISTFTAAICLTVSDDTIDEAKIAYGAVGPVVLRLPNTEQFLSGKPFTLETMQQAGDVAVKEITPISDVRGGVDFRVQLARNVLLKYYHQCRPVEVSA